MRRHSGLNNRPTMAGPNQLIGVCAVTRGKLLSLLLGFPDPGRSEGANEAVSTQLWACRALWQPNRPGIARCKRR